MMNDQPHAALLSTWDIYVVGDRALAGGMTHRDIAAIAYESGAKVYQMREKGDVPDADLIEDARATANHARSNGTTFIINDRIGLAAEAGAHGVHLGQGDASVAHAREVLGEKAIIGFSTHNLQQLEAAIAIADAPETRIDYLSLGPIYPTTSKQNPDPVVDVATIEPIRHDIRIPLVAIGGITVERVPSVLAAGFDIAAVIGAAMAKSPLAMSRQVRELIRTFHDAQGGRVTQ